MKKIINLILALIAASSVSFAGGPDHGNGPGEPGNGGKPGAPVPLVTEAPGAIPDMPLHAPCSFVPLNSTPGARILTADVGYSSSALCLDFRPGMVDVASIELRNLTTGSINCHVFGYTAGWFSMPFSGDAGYWEITVYAMDGCHLSGSFYCSGFGGGTPGGGFGVDNGY